jgi:hypothetical protein
MTNPHNTPTQYQAKTNINQQLNSDHHPVTLNIPFNTLISRTPTFLTDTKLKILNPISSANMEKFKIKFSEDNTHCTNTLTNLLKANKKLSVPPTMDTSKQPHG